jgi:hypothetical protein
VAEVKNHLRNPVADLDGKVKIGRHSIPAQFYPSLRLQARDPDCQVDGEPRGLFVTLRHLWHGYHPRPEGSRLYIKVNCGCITC